MNTKEFKYTMRSVTNSESLLLNLINPEEVITSNDLVHRCVAQGLSDDQSRQLIKRTAEKGVIWRSESLSLRHNSRLFAHPTFRGSADFLQKCLPILSDERPGLHRLIQKLSLEEVVLKPHAELVLASPISAETVRQPSYEIDIAALEELGAARREMKGTLEERLVSNRIAGTPNATASGLRALSELMMEHQIAQILMEHFKKLNFISWGSGPGKEYLGNLVIFNNYLFHSYSFSWLSEMKRWRANIDKPKPTPVLLQVCSGLCNRWDIEGFMSRLQKASNRGKSRLPRQGVIAAPDFERTAFNLAKEEGFLVINLNDLFGEEAFEALVRVQELLKSVVGDSKKAQDSQYEALAISLANLKTNPFIKDIKTLAFETLVAFLAASDGWEEIRLNVKVPFKLPKGATEREVDVSGQKHSWSKIYIVECKAESSEKPLSATYVRKFYEETLPAFLAARPPKMACELCRAEIWTTGVVGQEALEALKEVKYKSFVEPKLLGREDILKTLPANLKSMSRLIQTIAHLGNAAATSPVG